MINNSPDQMRKLANLLNENIQPMVESADAAEEFEYIQAELFELIDRLENAIQEYLPSQINYWRSYGLAHLKVIAGSSEYAASDKSIQDLIDEANSEEEDEDY